MVMRFNSLLDELYGLRVAKYRLFLRWTDDDGVV